MSFQTEPLTTPGPFIKSVSFGAGYLRSGLKVGTSRIWMPGQVKPTSSPPKIDWSHPLSAGLLLYAFDDGTNVVDLVRGTKGAFVGTSGSLATQASNPFGPSLQYNHGTSTLFQPNCLSSPDHVNKFTAAGAFFTTSSQTNGVVFNVSDVPGNTFSGNVIVFLTTSSNTVTFLGNTQISQIATWTPSPSLGSYRSVAITCDGSVEKAFGDGILQGTGNFTDPLLKSTTQVLIGDFVNTTYPTGLGFRGSVPYFGLWNRPLSAPEMMQLHLDPYCFLMPAAYHAVLSLT